MLIRLGIHILLSCGITKLGIFIRANLTQACLHLVLETCTFAPTLFVVNRPPHENSTCTPVIQHSGFDITDTGIPPHYMRERRDGKYEIHTKCGAASVGGPNPSFGDYSSRAVFNTGWRLHVAFSHEIAMCRFVFVTISPDQRRRYNFLAT